MLVWNDALAAPRRLPGLDPDRARRRGHIVRLHALRGLLDLDRPPRRVVQPAAALDDVGRDDRRGRGARSALRWRSRALITLFGVRLVRALRAVGGEHADALADARCGLALAPGRDPAGDRRGPLATVRRAITPVLDAMQIVPAFAYLMPVVILFSIGPAAAVVSTMIYAIPPAIRITALGIRGVAVNTVEAATSLGATRMQLLRKVQLPLARRMILLGVNQTILFAALDGGHRRADRRRRARRRRHQRALLEPGAGDPSRARDRRHGDGARPVDGGDGRPHRSREAAPRRVGAAAAATRDRADGRRGACRDRALEGARRSRRVSGRGGRSARVR